MKTRRTSIGNIRLITEGMGRVLVPIALKLRTVVRAVDIEGLSWQLQVERWTKIQAH